MKFVVLVFATLASLTVHAQYIGLPPAPGPVYGPGPGPNPGPGPGPGPSYPAPAPAPAPTPAPYPSPAPTPEPYPAPNPTPVPRALAEIQIFLGYRGYNNYDSKVVSTQNNPLSIDYIYSGDRAAACYKGDPSEALRLFGAMIDRYNYENRRAIRFTGANFYYYSDGKGALQVESKDERGESFVSFPRIIECDRWSTPAERGEY